MRFLIVMLFFSTTLQAQSLADLARQERARRATQQVRASRVFTTEDLARAAQVDASEVESEPDRETTADASREVVSEEVLAAWEEAVDEQLGVVLELEYREGLHREGIAIYGEILADSSSTESERREAIFSMPAEQDELDALLPELEEARKVLEELRALDPGPGTMGDGS